MTSMFLRGGGHLGPGNLLSPALGLGLGLRFPVVSIPGHPEATLRWSKGACASFENCGGSRPR